jgi:protein-tyrosine phosphatase
MPTLRILLVCRGNICRSPTAEGVLRALARGHGIADRLVIDSAAIEGWHVGEAPDPRATSVAQAHGVDIGCLRARQLQDVDFASFDLILGMDRANMEALRARRPPSARARLACLADYLRRTGATEIPDPYLGDISTFEQAYALIRAACEGLLAARRGGEGFVENISVDSVAKKISYCRPHTAPDSLGSPEPSIDP